MSAEQKLKFALTRPAKTNGGDRYEADVKGEPKPLAIYLPQTWTRDKAGKIVENITATFAMA